MTTRQRFRKAMAERRQYPRGGEMHAYMTRVCRKMAWLALGVPTTEWTE